MVQQLKYILFRIQRCNADMTFTLNDIKNSACAKLNPHLFEEKEKKKSKYKNEKVELDGYKFDSKREARRYVELRTLLTIGEITDLKVHERFKLSVCVYEADFTYYRNGEFIVEDSKGFRTKEYRLKKKLMKSELNIEIKEV